MLLTTPFLTAQGGTQPVNLTSGNGYAFRVVPGNAGSSNQPWTWGRYPINLIITDLTGMPFNYFVTGPEVIKIAGGFRSIQFLPAFSAGAAFTQYSMGNWSISYTTDPGDVILQSPGASPVWTRIANQTALYNSLLNVPTNGVGTTGVSLYRCKGLRIYLISGNAEPFAGGTVRYWTYDLTSTVWCLSTFEYTIPAGALGAVLPDEQFSASAIRNSLDANDSGDTRFFAEVKSFTTTGGTPATTCVVRYEVAYEIN